MRILYILFFCFTPPCKSFVLRPLVSSARQTNLALFDEGDVEAGIGADEDFVLSQDSSNVHEALQARNKALQNGIGRRYVCRTQHGFLNVHKEPGDPYNTYNIVGQLMEGQIVTSTGPTRGGWVKHDGDGGGWSVSVHAGFTWLQSIDE
jgi:hypothetical protein